MSDAVNALTLTDELQYAAEVGAEIAERYRLLARRVDVLSDEERGFLINSLVAPYCDDAGQVVDVAPRLVTHLFARLADPDAVVVVLTRTEAGDE